MPICLDWIGSLGSLLIWNRQNLRWETILLEFVHLLHAALSQIEVATLA